MYFLSQQEAVKFCQQEALEKPLHYSFFPSFSLLCFSKWSCPFHDLSSRGSGSGITFCSPLGLRVRRYWEKLSTSLSYTFWSFNEVLWTRQSCWRFLLDDTSRDFAKKSTKTKCYFLGTSSLKAGFYILSKQNSKDNHEEYKISQV